MQGLLVWLVVAWLKGVVVDGLCDNNCYGAPCDYWDGGYWGTCSDLEQVYGCDCRGCVCDGCPQGDCGTSQSFDPMACPLAGNAECDESMNTADCAFDGGDCCETTCRGTLCGSRGLNCVDPHVIGHSSSTSAASFATRARAEHSHSTTTSASSAARASAEAENEDDRSWVPCLAVLLHGLILVAVGWTAFSLYKVVHERRARHGFSRPATVMAVVSPDMPLELRARPIPQATATATILPVGRKHSEAVFVIDAR